MSWLWWMLPLFHRSRLTFTNPDKDDLGKYSVVVTDTDGVSASHTLTEDGQSCLQISLNVKSSHKNIRHRSEFVFLNLSCSPEHYVGAQLCHQTSKWVFASQSNPVTSSLFPTNLIFKCLFLFQLFLWNMVWTMRFWRKDTCDSGCRQSNFHHLCPTDSLSTTKKSRVGR